MAEDVTGLPMLLQGQQGKAPETVGGMQLLQNNASSVIRRLAKSFDSGITEPHIRRYYEYLMMYGPEENEKGEFQIDAKGSSTFVDKDIETQFVVQMAQLVANPAYGIDPKRWFAVTCKLRRFDPSQVQYTEAELKEQAQAAQQHPPQPDPHVIAAQATAQAAQTRAQATAQAAQTAAQADVQSAQIAAQALLQREQQIQSNETQSEQARNELARMKMDSEIQLATIARETAMMELSIKQNISLAQIRAMLADTAIKEQTKKELAALDRHMQMVSDAAKAAQPAPVVKAAQPGKNAKAAKSGLR
jgi:hypothetical protein